VTTSVQEMKKLKTEKEALEKTVNDLSDKISKILAEKNEISSQNV
jgi:hypothetical protein